MIKGRKVLMVAALLMGTTMGAMAIEPRADEVLIAHQTVGFGDLDLGNPAGVATLHFRLRMAASNVCDQGVGLTAHQLQRKCRSQAVERALASVPAVVAAYHAEWKADGGNWLAMPTMPAPTQLAAR